MSTESLQTLMALRQHLELRGNRDGVVELGFDLGILAAAPEIAGGDARQRLLDIPGVEGLQLSLIGRSLTIRYDPARLDPGFWDAVLTGSEAEARAALEGLPGPESEG